MQHWHNNIGICIEFELVFTPFHKITVFILGFRICLIRFIPISIALRASLIIMQIKNQLGTEFGYKVLDLTYLMIDLSSNSKVKWTFEDLVLFY